MVNKPKAIEIVKNLTQTIGKMTTYVPIEHKNGLEVIPRAKKSALVKRKQELIKKYKLK